MGMFKMVRVSDDKIIGYAPGEIITYQITLENQGLDDIAGTITLTNMNAVPGSGYEINDSGSVVTLDPISSFESVSVNTQRPVTEEDIEAIGGEDKSTTIVATAAYDYPEADLHAEVEADPVVLRRPDHAVGFSVAETSIPLNDTARRPLTVKMSAENYNEGLANAGIRALATDGLPVGPLSAYDDNPQLYVGWIDEETAKAIQNNVTTAQVTYNGTVKSKLYFQTRNYKYLETAETGLPNRIKVVELLVGMYTPINLPGGGRFTINPGDTLAWDLTPLASYLDEAKYLTEPLRVDTYFRGSGNKDRLKGALFISDES